ncbi:hypothetical protein Ndes2526B_g03378 [Nannochloris sp. 'desiccata']|nr:putative Pheophorbide a oxygenase, chloroplastic [Chlorella desiccata (nom. nud.)]
MQAVISSSIGASPRLVGPFHSFFLGSRHTFKCKNIKKSSKGHALSPQAIATPPTYSNGSLTTANQAPEEGFQSSSASSFDWKDHWYPVVFEHDVAPGQLYKFTLLNTPIVIWRDGAAVRAFRDACPHRLVPLSEGRIAPNGCLECPYHGWQFDGEGACKSIPQGGDISHPRAQATSFQCVAKQGLIWVRLQPHHEDGSPTAADDELSLPLLPELDDPDWFELTPMWRDLPMEYSTLIENVVDAGHVPFTHHASVSKRQSSGMFEDMRIEEKGPWGFKGIWPTGPRKGGLGAQLTHFQGPNLMRHTIDAFSTRGFANITAVYGVPTTPGRCRLIVRQPFKFKNKLIRKAFGIMPQFMGHLGNLSVLDDDNIFLHLQERESVERGLTEKPIGQVYYMPGSSDAYVMAFRGWLDRIAGGGPFGPQNAAWLAAAGPRLSKTELLDHYHSHTENCSICRTALARLKVVRAAAAVLAVGGSVTAVAAAVTQAVSLRQAALSASSASLLSLPAAPFVLGGLALAVVTGAVWAWCFKTIPRFFEGVHPPARNRVPGEYTP